MVVYVLNIDGKPLMPTTRFGKVRKMLKNKEAKVVKREPFTIQLLYKSTIYTQPISLGVDAGSKTIGISATTENKELFCAEVKLRNNIVELLATRKHARRFRRSRKTRYRQVRFNNRVRTKKKGWLAPSIQNKIDTHLTIISRIYKILPITNIVVEVASFDIQKIKNPNIQGKEYQEGEQLGFGNVREYVLCRDGHLCQCCKGKSKDLRLNIHHIESRKIGGNAPNNLITLCKTCHRDYHKGKIQLPKTIKRGMKFNDAAFMGIMRWAFYNTLKNLYSNVSLTYGYITKNTRINCSLPKEHYIDARCISGNPLAKPLGICYKYRKLRCHNRQLHKFAPDKRGVRQISQAPYKVFGFRLFDKVKYNNQICFINRRRQSGYFSLRTIDGLKIGNDCIPYKRLLFVENVHSYICQPIRVCA